MNKLYFNQLFTGECWYTDGVTLELDASGSIRTLVPGPAPKGAQAVTGVAVPGMPNLHSHAHQRAMAGLAEFSAGSDNFWSWRDAMYRQIRGMQPHHLQAIAEQLYLEMLKSGYTAVAEFQYLHHDVDGAHYQNKAEMTLSCLEAARQTGIGISCLPVLYQHGGFKQESADDTQKRFHNQLDDFLSIHSLCLTACRDDANSTVGIAPHSLRAVDATTLNELLQLVTDGPVHIHIAEQIAEVEECLAVTGQRPLQRLLSTVAVNDRWCVIHATHMTEEETLALADSQATAGLCPTTEANLGDGFFPAQMYLDHKGYFGIGSDSQISVNPVEELRWLEYGQRLLHGQRNVLSEGHTGASLFGKALVGGARASGRAIGRLQPGYRADIVVLDDQQPRLFGRHRDQLLDSWIFAGDSHCIKHVFVGGEQRLHDGHHPLEKAITDNFLQTIKQLSEQDSS